MTDSEAKIIYQLGSPDICSVAASIKLPTQSNKTKLGNGIGRLYSNLLKHIGHERVAKSFITVSIYYGTLIIPINQKLAYTNSLHLLGCLSDNCVGNCLTRIEIINHKTFLFFCFLRVLQRENRCV